MKFVLFVILLLNYDGFSQAQILEGLKDAVLTAEGTLGDVFRAMDSLAKHLKFSKEAWQDSVEEECKYLCKDGTTPKKNKYYTSSSNGCGVPGMEIDSQYLPVNDMTSCCDQHDICYGTCNKDKEECDLAFKKCLYRLCNDSKKDKSETFLTGCKTAAKLLHSGTLMFGCKAYKMAQHQACFCPPPRKYSGDEL